MRDAKVDVWVAGEQAPRRFEQADATVRLGHGYKRLTVDLTAAVHERDPSTFKCAYLRLMAANYVDALHCAIDVVQSCAIPLLVCRHTQLPCWCWTMLHL